MFQREYPEPGTLLNDLWHVTRHDEKWVWLGLYLYMCFFFSELSERVLLQSSFDFKTIVQHEL